MLRCLAIAAFWLYAWVAHAQLDTIHFLPPMHARAEWGPQYIYLSTPEKTDLPVTIRDGAGNLVAFVTIRNDLPYRLDLGSTNNTFLLVSESGLHKPLQARGLIASGPRPFYMYFRAHSNSGHHAGDLTCKGRAALGTVFRIAHLEQAADDNNRRSNFIGILATEDSTVVTLSDFDPATDFHIGTVDVPSNGPVTAILQKGESIVFSQYISFNTLAQPPNGFMGALVTATKPIAVHCGSWVGAPVEFQAHDIGIDQIAPLEEVGKEYILCKGNGSSILEHPIIVAHYPNTKIWLNGNANPAIVLNAGDYYIVPTNAYSPAGNMYVRSSEPVFMYQMIGGTAQGDDAMRTAGLIFVPPVSCAIPNSVDNIFEPNRIGGMIFEGGLMLVAMKDSLVQVEIDGANVPLGPPASVPGNPNFVTYRNLHLFTQTDNPKTLRVVAQGAVQVGMYGRNEPASFAAFFSGFSKTARPELSLEQIGDGVCPDTLVAHGHFDGVQWVYEDSLLAYGKDTMWITYAPGKYTAIGYLGVCFRTDDAKDTATLSFVSPQFPYTFEDPNCYGARDGWIHIGAPYGGAAPYAFSIDNGAHFDAAPAFEGLGAGAYHLVVRDSTGCYNRPLQIALENPDSFAVEIVPSVLPHPLPMGARVVLDAVSEHPVIASTWTPELGVLKTCPDCLIYEFTPFDSVLVAVEVVDTAGCVARDEFPVKVEPPLYVPNVFAPGSDGLNDRFTIFSRGDLPLISLSVYDRWGELVFRVEHGTTNHTAEGWDGNFRQKPALPGVYVYVAEVEMEPGRTVRLRGDVLLLR